MYRHDDQARQRIMNEQYLKEKQKLAEENARNYDRIDEQKKDKIYKQMNPLLYLLIVIGAVVILSTVVLLIIFL